jgi:hypothetical protein
MFQVHSKVQFVVLVILILPFLASVTFVEGQTEGGRHAKRVLRITGTLVEGGAECQRFRADSGKFYTLEGDLRGFRTGDRVKIVATISQASHCMQDTPLRVVSIEPAKGTNTTRPSPRL